MGDFYWRFHSKGAVGGVGMKGIHRRFGKVAAHRRVCAKPAGTATLAADTLTSNTAKAGSHGHGGTGAGGGLYVAAGATVYLGSFTLTNTINNIAVVDRNIDGSYTLVS
jgi:hypothetical protein